jgi:hypothetical protein
MRLDIATIRPACLELSWRATINRAKIYPVNPKPFWRETRKAVPVQLPAALPSFLPYGEQQRGGLDHSSADSLGASRAFLARSSATTRAINFGAARRRSAGCAGTASTAACRKA